MMGFPWNFKGLMPETSRELRLRLRVPAVLFLSPLTLAAAQSFLSLQAPIQKFFLPLFDLEGRRQWEVEGQEARMNSLDRVEIRDMKMRLFLQNKAEVWRIESPSAYVFPRSAVVEGREKLSVRGRGFSASGCDWQWFGKNRQLRVHRQVEVHFVDAQSSSDSAQP
ncbi:MAG: hypothetical protein LBF21_02720 [Puniceicoccales bacterium]|jgi:lipopolysaccharide export system protein LptC|nr:hypothetical protein [Puniceicoccales bacterium]